MAWYDFLIEVGVSSALAAGGAKLRNRDEDETGADDAWGRVAILISPHAAQLVRGGSIGANATLKAMRALEMVAHEYRVQVGDVPIVAEREE